MGASKQSSLVLWFGALLAYPCIGKEATIQSEYYTPEQPTEPFDTVATVLNSWITDPKAIDHFDEHWRSSFCNCMGNGNLASWYQMAPSMYMIDKCSIEDGFVLRTSHLQERYTIPLQAMISCDTLKLVSYCLSHTVGPDTDAIKKWEPVCSLAHFSVNSCDVDCSGAPLSAHPGRLLIATSVLLAMVGTFFRA